MLSRCKVCLLGDMNSPTGDKHEISYDKHVVEKIAGEINVGGLFANEKN